MNGKRGSEPREDWKVAYLDAVRHLPPRSLLALVKKCLLMLPVEEMQWASLVQKKSFWKG